MQNHIMSMNVKFVSIAIMMYVCIMLCVCLVSPFAPHACHFFSVSLTCSSFWYCFFFLSVPGAPFSCRLSESGRDRNQSDAVKSRSELFESKRFSDVTLVTDDQTQFEAHRIILAGASKVFDQLLSVSAEKSSLIFLNGVKIVGESMFLYQKLQATQ